MHPIMIWARFSETTLCKSSAKIVFSIIAIIVTCTDLHVTYAPLSDADTTISGRTVNKPVK